MSKLAVGNIYKHYKGWYYIVEALAKCAETKENMVVYRALYGNKQIWVRPVKEFIGEVDGKGYYRFEEVTSIIEGA